MCLGWSRGAGGAPDPTPIPGQSPCSAWCHPWLPRRGLLAPSSLPPRRQHSVPQQSAPQCQLPKAISRLRPLRAPSPCRGVAAAASLELAELGPACRTEAGVKLCRGSCLSLWRSPWCRGSRSHQLTAGSPWLINISQAAKRPPALLWVSHSPSEVTCLPRCLGVSVTTC